MEVTLRPARVPPPGRILRRELEARGWTQKDLAEIIKRSEKTISQIVNGHKQITPETALELAAAFGTSPELWSNLEANYRLHQAQKEHTTNDIERRARLYNALPITEMQKRGWLREPDSLDELEGQACAFLGIASLGERPRLPVSFRQSMGRIPEVGVEVVWIKRIEHLASAQQVKAFSLNRLEKAIPDLLALSAAPERVTDIPGFLMSLGVHFCIVPHLPRTYLDGAAFMLDEHPVIALTLRYNRIDNFWFTLLHELAHVVAGHEGGYLDNLDQEATAPEETEANRMAQDWLIDPRALARFVAQARPYFSRKKICAFARRQNRHPGIVVGRLHHDDIIPPGNLRALQVDIREHLTSWVDVAVAA